LVNRIGQIQDTMRKANNSILAQLYQPPSESHKGENGRLLVIGGSKLFHASIFWSADVASKIVDLVHFTSPANENNDLVRMKLKQGFWNGIVVDWSEVEDYIAEDDCILIGPGMSRGEDSEDQISNIKYQNVKQFAQRGSGELFKAAQVGDTRTIVNTLLAKYPEKRWVVDGGALQEVDPRLLNQNCIITPHYGELKRLFLHSGHEFLISNIEFLNKIQFTKDQIEKLGLILTRLSTLYGDVTVIQKGIVDLVVQGDEVVVVEGGNAGMTKGGTGDVLAGLTAALYCKNNAFLAAQVASMVNKRAGEQLAEKQGMYYGAGDLVVAAAEMLAELSREIQVT
jgi:NAD(P)H-hydrate repair Nnr-like enzyme with NAD(P)H-hydrate dehydratase domain